LMQRWRRKDRTSHGIRSKLTSAGCEHLLHRASPGGGPRLAETRPPSSKTGPRCNRFARPGSATARCSCSPRPAGSPSPGRRLSDHLHRRRRCAVDRRRDAWTSTRRLRAVAAIASHWAIPHQARAHPVCGRSGRKPPALRESIAPRNAGQFNSRAHLGRSASRAHCILRHTGC